MKIRDISSVELVKEIKIGWSLGNTLDVRFREYTGNEFVEKWETGWHNPVTTKAMIDMVKAKGFNILRLPVTWEGKIGEAPDYIIREDWFARVKEVADYGIDNGMFVIVNTHHDDWVVPSQEKKDEVTAKLRAIWKQIAEYFMDYDEHLIFEGLNEPRLIGTPLEWNGGDDAAKAVVNAYNMAFVDTVRKTGGNNEKRHLIIPTYGASHLEHALRAAEIPDDDKVILSVHAYIPYEFALKDDGRTEWSTENHDNTVQIDALFSHLRKLFTDKGKAVILGEFGALNRGANLSQRVEWAKYYVSRAKEAGVPCIWWDDNPRSFGLLDRRAMEWRFPEIADAMMKLV